MLRLVRLSAPLYCITLRFVWCACECACCVVAKSTDRLRAQELLADRREALQTWFTSRTKKPAPRDEAAHRAEVAQNEQTVQRLSVSVLAELDRFGLLLHAAVRHALRNFAALQMKHHAALAAQWRDSLPDG